MDFAFNSFSAISKAYLLKLIIAEYCFSFNTDTPLDMRVNTSYFRLKASDVLNTFDQRELEKIFFENNIKKQNEFSSNF